MKHFSHPHSLKLSESPKKDEQDEEEIMCSGCELKLSSPDAYTCTKRDCNFVLHKSCFELPTKTENKSHPKHSLTLLSEPPQYSLYYDCNACGAVIKGFSYECDKCDRFRLHVSCVSLAESVECKAHSHALELRYYTPKPEDSYITYCNVCESGVSEGFWSYHCKECDFTADLECAFTAEVMPEKEENEEEENEDAEEEDAECDNGHYDGMDKKTKMKHFSHPHSLKLSESPKKDEQDDEEIKCSGCELQLSSPDAYTCTKRDCDFVLHNSCFELPTKTENKSHPKHSLTLLSEPPQYSLYYDCNACGALIKGFSYECDECDSFRLHVSCAALAESVECKAHSHALELRYYTPKPEDSYITYCNVCESGITESYWSYHCKECDFTADLECAFTAEVMPEKEENEEEEDAEGDDGHYDGMSNQMALFSANIRAMDQMAKLNFSRQMNQMNAQFVRNL